MRGGDGVPQPAAGADFFAFFLLCPNPDFLLVKLYLPHHLVCVEKFTLLTLPYLTCFHGNSAYLRPCYHALRHPFGAADRAMLLK